MSGVEWLIAVGVAMWLAIMELAVTLPLAPARLLRLTERITCPPGAKMEVRTPQYAYHRPGEKGLEVRCVGRGVNKDVKFKALLTLWLAYFGLSFALVVLTVTLIH